MSNPLLVIVGLLFRIRHGDREGGVGKRIVCFPACCFLKVDREPSDIVVDTDTFGDIGGPSMSNGSDERRGCTLHILTVAESRETSITPNIYCHNTVVDPTTIK